MKATVDGLVRDLQRSQLFDEWEESDLESIAAPARLRFVHKGAALYLDGDPRAFIYQVNFGLVKVSRLSRDGKELILDIIGPGRLFGETSILDDGPQDSIAQALRRSALWAIPKTGVERVLRKKPELAFNVVRTIAEQKKMLQERLENHAFKRAPGRLATLLLQLGQEFGVPDRGGTLVPIQLSHEQMGSYIGASREIVCNSLSCFRRQGLIAQRGRQLLIRRHEPLARVS